MNLSGNASKVLAIIYDETRGETRFINRPRLFLLAAEEMSPTELESCLAELAQFAYISVSGQSFTITRAGLDYLRAVRDRNRSTTAGNITIGKMHVDNRNQYSGDHYDNRNNQVGVQGPGAKAENITQQADHRQVPVNLTALADELDNLRQKMAEEARSAADYHAVAEIQAAIEATSAKDEPSIRQHLANAGQWALDVAKSIGTELAVAALKHALGIDA